MVGVWFRLGPGHTAQGEPVVAIAVISRIDTRGIEVQAAHTEVIEASRGPEEAVRALTARRAGTEVARER